MYGVIKQPKDADTNRYLINQEMSVLDRECAQLMMNSDFIPRDDAWHAMFIVDSTCHLPEEQKFVGWNDLRPRRVCNCVSLPDLSNYIYSLSYRRSLSTQKSKLCYLLSKVLNEKCQARKFSSVFLDCYEPRHNIGKYIKSIVLCGLLGAYPTSLPSSRPRVEVRARLYQLISNCAYRKPVNHQNHQHAGEDESKLGENGIKLEQPQQQQQQQQQQPSTESQKTYARHNRKNPHHHMRSLEMCNTCAVSEEHGGSEAENWFLYLLTKGGIVVLYCIREYIHYMLSINPCLLEQIREEIHYDETLKVTQDAMNTIRRFFDQNLANPFSDMYSFTDDVMKGRLMFDMKQTDDIHPTSWFYQLSCVMYPYQRSMLLISHNRSNKTMQESLLTACKKLNMVPMPSKRHQTPVSVPVSVASDDDNDDALAAQDFVSSETCSSTLSAASDLIMTQLYHSTGNGQSLHHPEHKLKAKNHKGPHANVDPLEDSAISEHRKMIGLCITKEHRDVIYNILKRSMKDETTDSIETICKFFTVLGVDKETRDFVEQVIEKRKANKVSDEKLRKFLVTLQKKKPHAYNILQATAYLSHNIVAFSITSVLPMYITKNQISAIQSRFGQFMVNSNCIPETACTLYYCSVCHTIYSIVRDFVYGSKQSYEYGVLNALVDHKTGHMYCRNNHIGAGESCASTPLVKINILGLLMRIKDQPIMLCPQHLCGVPMVFSNQCAWTERGPCCSKCTIKRNSEASMRIDTASSLLLEPFDKSDPGTHPQCEICGNLLSSLGKMFWYPHSVIVCCAHTSTSIQKKFKEAFVESDMGRQQSIDLLKLLVEERAMMSAQRRQVKDRRMRLQEERKRRNGLGISVEPGEQPLKRQRLQQKK